MFSIVLICLVLTSSLGAILPDVPRHNSRIVGGDPATIEDAPYQVSFLVDIMDVGSFNFFCGGSIIRPNVILSAAHCVELPSNIKAKVRAGSTNYASGGTLVDVKKVVGHKLFNNRLDYDYSLIFLAEDLVVDNVTIALAELPAEGVNILPGADAFITGWGAISEDGLITESLRKVTVPVIDQGVCEALYAAFNPVTSRMICAGVLGSGGQDACQGDSGGPLTVDGVLIGVTSWGLGCAKPDYPGVWSRVSAVLTWIEDTIANNSDL